jgi:hypothetical protein
MNDTESYIAQAVQSAKEEDPNGMKDSIGNALMNKIGDAVDLKKISMAGELFGEKNEDEEDEDENGSEEEEEENGKKKKKNPFAKKKKNGDDDEDDDDEEEDVDEGAIGDVVKAVGSSVRGALDRRAEAQKKKKDLEHVRNIARKYR